MARAVTMALAVAMLGTVAALGAQALAEDYPRREPVTLPADAKAIFLAQMLGHMVALDSIVVALGKGDYAAAAGVAEVELAVPRFQRSGDGEAEGPGLGIGKHLPAEFRAIGKRFRAASGALAELARSLPSDPSAGQVQMVAKALGRITTECRICHDSYRIE